MVLQAIGSINTMRTQSHDLCVLFWVEPKKSQPHYHKMYQLYDTLILKRKG